VSVRDQVVGLIEDRIQKVNTLAMAVITKVDLARWQADIRLKHKIQDVTLDLTAVPIALQSYGTGAIHIAPAIGDVVLVGFSKHEIRKQLRNRDVVAVNELVLHNLNHAVIISGIHAESDTVPAVAAGEILISHKTGAYLKFKNDGSMEFKIKEVNWMPLT
jgi:hypothetical protein